MARILMLTLFLALSGCPEEPRSPIPELKQEQQRRIEAEARIDRVESSKGKWQTFAFITSVSAVLLLILGTILGSKCRQNAERRG